MKDHLGNVAISMKDKKALVRKNAFPPPPKNDLRQPKISKSVAHQKISQYQVYCALVAQSIKKAPGPDKINFGILHIVWSWKAEWMTMMV